MRPISVILLAALCGSAPAQLFRQANNTLVFPQTLPSPTGYAVENAIGTTTFSSPICLRTLPGVTNQLFVVERGGAIQKVNLDTGVKTLFCNLSSYLTAQGTPIRIDSESGLLSVAFHPQYNQNGLYFIFYSFNSTSATGSQRHQRVARLRATGTAGNYHSATATDVAATHTPLITQRDEAGNHNGGDMHFGNDGYLYISAGDEGAQYDGSNNARHINGDFLGGIMRIDVDLKQGSVAPNAHSQPNSTAYPSAVSPGTYTIPPDNPFIGFTSWNGFTFAANTVRTEWWAHGFRNPWRMGFDYPTSRLFVADVGQDTWEEVSIITKGANGGWSWREGAHNHTPANAPTTPPSTPGAFVPVEPIYDYQHGSNAFQGNSVTGGYIYRGTRLTELTGQYIFADYASGRIWALRDTGVPRWTALQLYDEENNQIAAFGQDPRNGDVLYCYHNGTGVVKRLVRSFGGTPPPATLSATGAFSNVAALIPHAGIDPYEPNVSHWTDHAVKTRWFSIPNIALKMTYAQEANWTFPAGQVWIQHLEIEMTRGSPATKRKLETRFLVKNASAAYGVTYKWRTDGSDADLVGADGLTETLNIIENGNPVSQTWRYPSRNDCISCHRASSGHVLGFNPAQLNRTYTYGAQSPHILTAWSDAGYFSQPVAGGGSGQRALARLDDASQSVEWRVRSYFSANCSHCHRPDGVQGNWDGRYHTATDAAEIINGALTDDAGDPLNRFLVFGDVTHSMVLKRMRDDTGDRMPPLATNMTDQEATDVITQWIGALPVRESFAQWQTAHFGSPADPDAAAAADPDRDGVPNDREFLLRTDPEVRTPDAALEHTVSGQTLMLQHPEIPGRSTIVETSSDLNSWLPLEHPDNRATFPAAAAVRNLSVPLDAVRRYLRLRIESL